jgi:hypothetical protein
VKWQPNSSFDFSKPEGYPTEMIKVHSRQTTVAMMEQQLADLFFIPVDRLVIELRHERGLQNIVTCEYFNMDWRKSKVVGDFGSLQHGVTLFVEENDPKGSFEEFRWKKEFDAEIEKITVSVNQNEDGEPMRIKVDRNDTIKQLKAAVSERISLPVTEFYFVRKSTNQEVKDVNKTLAALGFTNGVNLRLVMGHAKNEGVYTVNIS